MYLLLVTDIVTDYNAVLSF